MEKKAVDKITIDRKAAEKKRSERNRLEKSKEYISLILLLTFVAMGFLLITILIVGAIVFFTIYQGMLKLDYTGISAKFLFFTFFGLSFLIGIILFLILIHFPLKPVTKILDVTSRLASGDYSARLHFKGPFAKLPPFRKMADSFNTMAEELGQIEMLRSDFINNFSHEFKTPIVSIAGFTKLLKKGNLPEETKAEYLDIIEAESLRLSALATNVLNLAKVENQSILSDTEEFNLSEQIRNCVLLLESKWSKKNIEPVLPEEEYLAYGNEELLTQVWINTLDNAIKFSEEDSAVEVEIRETGEYTQVRISNYGAPIPEDKRERIFGKFYQADESHATEGNGVGLAVVKKIVELHKGYVDVECVDGKNTFVVTLPRG